MQNRSVVWVGVAEVVAEASLAWMSCLAPAGSSWSSSEPSPPHPGAKARRLLDSRSPDSGWRRFRGLHISKSSAWASHLLLGVWVHTGLDGVKARTLHQTCRTLSLSHKASARSAKAEMSQERLASLETTSARLREASWAWLDYWS